MNDKTKKNIGAFVVSGMLIGMGYVLGRITRESEHVDTEEYPAIQPTEGESSGGKPLNNGVHKPISMRFYWRTRTEGDDTYTGHFLTVETKESLSTDDVHSIEDMVLNYQNAEDAAPTVTEFIQGRNYSITGIRRYDC